ncbi:MAG: carbohydrate esterase family protein [Haliea sp.]|uniref:polysaccharide deacetylase family protein n=1 Tax=Haliea sp. TaxID=1932666 RepID=UPI000C620F33|nr:polysaccharide deacetylase family protein [Haliea sp.]MBM70772.1 carbohydrate esterase family protein [Haliea sp.]|tara:strand:+ start:1916 stop:2884 length:969 start_codon:yes stop_codon:yes gene_type:complete
MADLQQLAFRAGLTLAGLARRQRLSILIYHRVLPRRDWMRPAEPTAEEFDWQMQLLSRHFNVLPLHEAVRLLRKGRLPPRAACITFDDGYADNATVALPVLQRHGLPATVFVASGYLDGGRMWNDTIVEALRVYDQPELDLAEIGLPRYDTSNQDQRRRTAHAIIREGKYLDLVRRDEIASCVAARVGPLPDDLMLTSAQLRVLHNSGVEIGGHTVSHPILAQLTVEQAREQIQSGKAQLEGLLDAPLRTFAYPNGRRGTDYTDEHVLLVREAGFELAVATNWGVSTPDTDVLQLPRFTPWDKSAARYLLRMALNMRRGTES